MSVYCVNSGNTYTSLSELSTAEAGLHIGEVAIELSGVNTGDASFTAQDFDSLLITAASGEEFDPTTSTGAIHAAKLTSTCPVDVNGTRIEEIAVVYPTTQILNSEIGSVGNVGITYGTSNNVYMYNTVIRDTYRGSYATGANPNATLENCTLYNNSNLGLLRCNCINTVVIDCAGTDYFSAVSQVNTWGDDASAQNLVTDGYATFVDFASGDVRIRSDSDAGLAGAGAFIQESVASSVDIQQPLKNNTSSTFTPIIDVYQDINVNSAVIDNTFNYYTPSVEISEDINITSGTVNNVSTINNGTLYFGVDINIAGSGVYTASTSITPEVSIGNDSSIIPITVDTNVTVFSPIVDISDDVSVVLPAIEPYTFIFSVHKPSVQVYEDLSISQGIIDNSSVRQKPFIYIGNDTNIDGDTSYSNTSVYDATITLSNDITTGVVNVYNNVYNPEIQVEDNITITSSAINYSNTNNPVITIGVTPEITRYTINYKRRSFLLNYRRSNHKLSYRNK